MPDIRQPVAHSSADPRTRRDPTPAIPLGAIVVALGPADETQVVLAVAAGWARMFNAPLVINQIVPEHPTAEDKGLCAQVYAWVDGYLGERERVYFEVRREDATQQLLAHAENSAARMIIMGESGHREGWLARIFRPSFQTSIVRSARCPVLIARRTHQVEHVVIAADLGADTPAFMRAAADEVRRTRARATVVHGIAVEPAWSITDLPIQEVIAATRAGLTEGAVRELRAAVAQAALPDAECRVQLQAPAFAITDLAIELGADLVIVGSHGRGNAARVLMGSVAEAVIREAPCNVLVIPIAALQDDLATRPHRRVTIARGTQPPVDVVQAGVDYELPETD